MSFGVKSLEFRVWGLGFRDKGLGFRCPRDGHWDFGGKLIRGLLDSRLESNEEDL